MPAAIVYRRLLFRVLRRAIVLAGLRFWCCLLLVLQNCAVIPA